MSNENLTILVELFGPLREYGTSVRLPLDEPLPFSGLFGRLEERLGSAFYQRVLRENITYILNDHVVDRDGSVDPMVHPGDRVAFALLLGGG
jgi:hypothetical protein